MIVLPSTLALGAVLLGWHFGRAGVWRLAQLHLRGGNLAVLACVLQMIGVATHAYRLPLLLTSTVLLFVFCGLNRRHRGVVIAATGVALNLSVMAANGGVMPISPTTLAAMDGPNVAPGIALLRSKDRVLRDDQARLPLLGDRLLLPGPLARLAAWSLGDLLLLAGVFHLLWHTMKGPDRHDTSLRRRAAPSGA